MNNLPQIAQKGLNTLLKSILLSLVVLLSGCGSVSSLLFYPSQEYVRTPKQLGLAYEEVTLLTEDEVPLFGWYLLPQGTARGNLLYLHGNGENISTHIRSIAWLPAQGYGVLALDYRGYGRSAGVAKLPEVFLDLAAASDWLFSQTQAPYYLLGQSLGSALAVGFSDDARAQQYSALLLDAPFTRYQDIARHALSHNLWSRWLLSPAARLLPDAYDPIDKIGGWRIPVLFYASANDRVVPLAQSLAVYQAASEPKQWSLHQGGHIATFADPEQRLLTLDFLSRYPPRP
jgi:fermentation-respiration switch protein FrsA (DUF1100 family)